MVAEQEGVIKYTLVFDHVALDVCSETMSRFNQLRSRLIQLEVFGQSEKRYEGLGFGNLSFRACEDSFYITGSQTGHRPMLISDDLALVDSYDVESHTLHAIGLTEPSSESMTHAVLYGLNSEISTVVHIHSPDIWHAAELLGLPSTKSDIPYGTPEMARAVVELARDYRSFEKPLIFSMQGHEDGVVVAGKDMESCLHTIETCLQKLSRYKLD